jgi:two-component system sensor kinase FixL
VHLSRVSEMGHMVSALAHEVNQPLSAVTSYIRAGERFTSDGQIEKGLSAMGKAAEQANRAIQTIRRIRSYLTKEKDDGGERRRESVATVIDEVRALALLAAKEQDVSIALRLDPAAREAFIDKIQIQQVLLNMTRNAAEAMAASARREIVISTGLDGDGMVEMSVADTGPGLAEKVRAKLFHPFISTKSDGMGVGLSICRTIIEAHGGRIWATDNPGGGTVFHLTVPRDGGATPAR